VILKRRCRPAVIARESGQSSKRRKLRRLPQPHLSGVLDARFRGHDGVVIARVSESPYQSIDTPLARIGAAQRAISRATKSRK
jgi:hypothetical protein